MARLLWIAAALAALAAPARADSFGGFSGIDRPYLVNQDKVCVPLAITDAGTAAGMPRCEAAAADRVAQLSIKPPIVQSGPDAMFVAVASGRALTVTRKTGEPVVRWDAPDPIGKLVEIYATPYGDRIAIAYTVRRAGRELTDVVAFDLGHNGLGGDAGAHTPPPTPPLDHTTPPTAPAPPTDPKLAASVKAARAAHGAPAMVAWARVLGLDAHHAEALFRQAELHAQQKHTGDALAALAALAASPRADAIEWRVEARFDPAFAELRADPKFRAAVGLDTKPTTPYERLMGGGGQWEQTGTSCDKAEVHLAALRDRTFKLRVKTVCEGQVMNLPFHGTWRVEDDAVILTLPTEGVQAAAADDAPCRFETHGDEDALHCAVGRDLDFVVLPVRR